MTDNMNFFSFYCLIIVNLTKSMIYSKIWFSTTLFLQLIYVRNDSAEQQNSNISFILIQMSLTIYNIQLLPFLFLLCMCLLKIIDFNNN